MISIVRMRGLVALGYMAGVLTLTLLPGRQVASWGFTGSLLDLAHVPMFTGLTLVTLWAVVGPRVQRLVLVATATILFAAADEQLQRFAPGRDASVADFARDVLGVAIGFLLAEGLLPLAVTFRKESQR